MNSKSTLKSWIKIETERCKNFRYEVATISNKLGVVLQTIYFDGYSLSSDNTENYYLFKNNFFAFNPARINVGSISINDKEKTFIISPMYVVFSTDYPDVIKWFTKSFIFNQLVKINVFGTVRNSLSKESLLEFPFFNLKQIYFLKNKIKEINFLDCYIKNLKSKLNLYKLLRKHYMSKMFL